MRINPAFCDHTEHTMLGEQQCKLPPDHFGHHSYFMAWTEEQWRAFCGMPEVDPTTGKSNTNPTALDGAESSTHL